MSDLSVAEFLSGAPDAVRHAEESLALWRALDDRYAITYALVNLGRALQLAGRHDEAVSPLLEGLAECRELGDVSEESLALYGLGLIELTKGNLDSAQQTLAESLRLVHATGEPWHIVERLEALAGLWVARGKAERAARLLGAAAAQRERGGFPLPPAEQADYDRWSAAIEATLGAEGFAAAMGTGRECPLDEVVAEALGSI